MDIALLENYSSVDTHTRRSTDVYVHLQPWLHVC